MFGTLPRRDFADKYLVFNIKIKKKKNQTAFDLARTRACFSVCSLFY